MKAEIIQRKWLLEWFDERMCYHMPSLTLADNGNLLAVWNGGFMQWNGDPMGRDAQDWVSILEPGASAWSNPEAIGGDIRYSCHDPIFVKNAAGEIILLYAKFLDSVCNYSTWCNGRDEIWWRKTADGGRSWTPGAPTALKNGAGFAPIRTGHPSNDGVVLDDGTIVFAATSTEKADYYFGAIRIYRSTDGGSTWQEGPLLIAPDGNKIREPALVLRPDGTLRIFSRTCPKDTNWGAGKIPAPPCYTCESKDGGLTWSTPVPTGITNNDSKIDVISWDEDALIMAYNDTPYCDWHQRSPLSLAYSKDEGRTWTKLLDLTNEQGNLCQPAMCRDRDGRLNIIYMHRHTAIEHLVVEIQA